MVPPLAQLRLCTQDPGLAGGGQDTDLAAPPTGPPDDSTRTPTSSLPAVRERWRGSPATRIRGPNPPPEGLVPCNLRSIVLQRQSRDESHPPGSTRALFLGAFWAKNQAGERPVCAAPIGLTVLPTVQLRGPVPPLPHHVSPRGLWGSTELTGGSSPLPRGPQQGQRRGKRTGRL